MRGGGIYIFTLPVQHPWLSRVALPIPWFFSRRLPDTGLRQAYTDLICMIPRYAFFWSDNWNCVNLHMNVRLNGRLSVILMSQKSNRPPQWS